MLFKINQEAQIKAIYQEADCDMTEQEFVKMCDDCHCIPHNFLLMDFAPKDASKKYRSGFDTYIYPKTAEGDAVAKDAVVEDANKNNDKQ